jgi:pimeloyl-ACP methyl ester carboxylesterase
MASSEAIPHSDIVFRRDGTGDRAVVFMHGFLDDQHVWNPVIGELTASEFETVQFDLAGFGDRAGDSGPFTYDRFAADLAAVVDTVGKPFVLVGHSMAAPVVELVAASRPGRAMGLVLLAPIPMGGTRLPDAAIESFRSLGELGAPELRAARRQAAPSAPEAEVERLATVAAKLRPEVVRAVADMWNNGYPRTEPRSGFSGPALILPGADDELITEVVASAVAARFHPAGTTVSAMAKSGHWPHVEHPSAVAAEINRFLANLEP